MNLANLLYTIKDAGFLKKTKQSKVEGSEGYIFNNFLVVSSLFAMKLD